MGSFLARILYPEVSQRLEVSDSAQNLTGSACSSPEHTSLDTAMEKMPEIMASLKVLKRHDWASLDTYRLLCFLKSFTGSCIRLGVDHQRLWMRSLTAEGLPFVLANAWYMMFSAKLFSKRGEGYLRNFRLLVSIGWQCTENSEMFCANLVQEGIISVLIGTLSSNNLSANKLEASNSNISRLYVAHGSWSMLHYVLKNFPESRVEFRQQNGPKLCYRFYRSALDIIRCKALLCLALGGTSNDLSAVFDANACSYMRKLYNDCLKQTDHVGKKYPFGAIELLHALSLLVVDQKFCAFFGNSEALEPLCKIVFEPVSSEELLTAIELLWMLAFDEQCCTLLGNDYWFMKRLRALEVDGNMLVTSAITALLHLLSKYKDRELKTICVSDPSCILITYHVKNKTVALDIGDQLRSAGFLIQMDDKKSTFDVKRAIESIEEANVVVVCVSEYFKNSPKCRLEADYANRLGKEIIALQIEPKYLADDWLGVLLEDKTHLDISSKKEDMSTKLKPLTTILNDQYVVNGWTNSASSRQLVTVAEANEYEEDEDCKTPTLRDCVRPVCSWSKQDVQEWLDKSNLADLQTLFLDFDGSVLAGLQKMLVRAPAVYYKSVQQSLGLNDIVNLLRFTNALEQLQ